MLRIKHVCLAPLMAVLALLLLAPQAHAQGPSSGSDKNYTHSDTFTPAWMVHLGVPLGTERVYLLGEGRLFLKQLDDIENNYQVSAGVRIRF